MVGGRRVVEALAMERVGREQKGAGLRRIQRPGPIRGR